MLFNILMKTPVPVKRNILTFFSAIDLLNEWGERATIGSIRFIWSEAGDLDWEGIENDPEWKWGRLT